MKGHIYIAGWGSRQVPEDVANSSNPVKASRHAAPCLLKLQTLACQHGSESADGAECQKCTAVRIWQVCQAAQSQGWATGVTRHRACTSGYHVCLADVHACTCIAWLIVIRSAAPGTPVDAEKA